MKLRLFVASLLALASAARAGTTIVVNPGPFPSAEAAARAEAKVNWLDADQADDTACTECFAALELQRYLRRMTGRAGDFAVVGDPKAPVGDLIRIRTAAGAGLGPEAYRIRSAVAGGHRVTTIEGGGRVGTLYGAYDLLYRLGCRWFAPGEVHEEIPRIETIPDLDVAEKPSFLTRGFHAWEDRGDADFLLWMARNRCNYWCVEQSNHPLVRKLGIMMSCAEHTAQSFFLNPPAPYPYNHPKFTGDEAKPNDPYPVGDHYQGDANGDGKLSYFEAHPEWYAFVNGKRIPGIRGGGGTNYCSSNPHATAEFFKNYVQSLIDGRYKGADIVRFWTLDGGRWCQCEACKALGSRTDRNLLLVHRLDQEIKKARAQGRINRPIITRFLAYADVLQPPTRPLPRTFDYDTCAATFFPIGRSYVFNFDDPRSTRNAGYARQLHGWVTAPKRHYRGQLCIGEYYNVSGFKCLPIVFMHTMANDIPYYHKASARHFHYMHCTTGNWGNKALTNYQMARQLWDVKTDCEALWTDYFAKRYGPAAPTMRRFYETLEKMFCNVRELKYNLARRLNSGARNLFPSPRLRYRREEGLECIGPTFLEIVDYGKQCRAIIDQAVAAAALDRIKARIAEDERLFTYGERTVAYYHACIQAFRLARAGKRDEARKHYAEARRIAALLADDKTSASMSSSHGSAANTFVASYATGALAQLAELLGPAKAEAIKPFDPRKGVLVLTGRDFSGGGAVRHDYRRLAHGADRHPNAQGNYVYAKSTGAFSRMAAWFRLPQAPAAPMTLTLTGVCWPVREGNKEMPAEFLVNGKRVFHGPAPFTTVKLSTHQCTIPPAVLKEGENKITIRNLAAKGSVGSRPWFGIDRVELRPATPGAKGEQR